MKKCINVLTLGAFLSVAMPVAAEDGWLEGIFGAVTRWVGVGIERVIGWTPLMDAALQDDVKQIEALIASGVDVNAQDGWGTSALLLAAMHNQSQIVQKLLAAGADVNIKAGWGTTPLMVASHHGYANIAEILLSAGADVNAQDNEGRTALKVAEFYIDATKTKPEIDISGHKNVIELLKQHGATEQ